MNYLKELWMSNWIEIRINRKLIYILLLLFGMMKLKEHVWMQGAIEGYQAGLQEQHQEKDDTRTHDVGKLDHSEDSPRT